MQRRSFIKGAVASSLMGVAGTKPLLALDGEQAKALTINYYNNWLPISYAGEDGVASGMLIDILNAVLKDKMNLDVLHRGLPWERAQREVQKGMADALCVVPNEAREEYLKFAHVPSFELKVILFYNKQLDAKRLDNATSVEDLKDLSFGELIGNKWGANVLKDHPQVAWVADQTSLFEMLSRGRVDVAMVPDVIGRYYMSQTSYKDSIGFCPSPFVQRETRMQLGISHHFPNVDQILKTFDREMAKLISSGERDQIVQGYMS